MGDAVYGVESFHINVQAGDSAAHLLVQFSGTTPAGNPVGDKPYVLSAVLIDGGDNAHEGPDRVWRFIQALRDRYDFKSPPLSLNPEGLAKFDSVVITHWDKDHYDGLAKVLCLDARNTVTHNPDIKQASIQISFFKYGDPPNKGRDHPLTTVYAPVWDRIPGANAKQTTRGAPTGRWGKSTIGSNPQEYLQVKFWATQRPNGIASLNQIARLDYTDLLGMEFFRQQKLVATAGLTSPAALLDQHRLSFPASPWPEAPGMYCLGVAGGTLPPPPLPPLPPVPPMPPPVPPVPPVPPAPPVPSAPSTVIKSASGVGVVNEHDSATNASSISCAIIWPGTTGIDAMPPRVAHYFAGDAEYETEQLIVRWVGKKKVRNVKASHHGSATSFPRSMIDDWQPDNIVISAGSAHGHPRWELLIYLYYHAWLRSIKSSGLDHARLHPTCFPYWFGKDEERKYVIPVQKRGSNVYSRISTAAFDGDTVEEVAYRAALRLLFARLDRLMAFFHTNNVLDEYRAQANDWRVRVQFLAKVCCERFWPFLSPLTPEYYPNSKHSAQCVFSGPSSMANIMQKSVAFVWVRSLARSDHETAGSYGWDWRLIGSAAQGSSSSSSSSAVSSIQVMPLPALLQPGGPTAADSAVILQFRTDPERPGWLEEELNNPDEDSGGWVPVTDLRLSHRPLTPIHPLLASPADQPNPISPAPPIPPIPGTGYFYCSTRTAQPGPRATTLDGLLEGFVSRLHRAWLGVAAAPAGPGLEVAVLTTDELYLWLDAVFGIHNFAVQGSTSTVTHTCLDLTLVGCQLHLSSSAVPWVFGLPQAALPTIPPSTPSPVLYADDALILGLGRATVPASLTLQGVCDDLQLPIPAFLADVASTIALDLTPVGEPGHRNALWFTPGMDYRATLRLVFSIRGIDPLHGTDPINSRLFAALGLAVHSATIIVRKSATFTLIDPGIAAMDRSAQLVFSIEIALKTGGTVDPTIDATLVYNFSDGSMRVVVQCNSEDTLGTYVAWVEQTLGITTGVEDYLKVDWIPSPRRVSLDLAAGTHAVERFEIDFEVTAPWGHDVVFLFTFSWTPSQQQIVASLWPGPLPASWLPSGMLPNMIESFEEYNEFVPTLSGAGTSIRLLDLLPGNLSESDLGLPSAINPDVFALSLTLTRTVVAPGSETLAAEFYGLLGSNAPPSPPAAAVGSDPSDFPQIQLESLGLDLQYSVERSAGPSPSGSTFGLNLNFSIGIFPRASRPDYGVANLDGSVSYSRVDGKGSWSICAHLDQLKIGHLVSFFQSDSQDGVMDLVEHIEVQSLELNYDCGGPGGTGNHFLFDGTLLLGSMEFKLEFEHWTDHWSFSAHLLAPDDRETIGTVLAHLTPEVVLPSFIVNVNLLGDDTGIHLEVWKDQLEINGVKTDYIVFKTDITLGHFSLTFIQYNTKGWPGPKRVFRAALSGPMDISTVPVVEKLTQPFDEIYFLYVQDRSDTETPKNPAGVLRQELPLLNKKLEPQFMFKETHKPQADGDTIIDAGLRFTVVATINNQPTVVLDHKFGSTTPKPAPAPTPPPVPSTPSVSPHVAGEDPGAPPATAPGDSSMATFHKTVGPLTISNIGIQFKDGRLTILLDATFQLGPINLALLGFGLELNFSQPDANLLHPPGASGIISGLGFGFVQPPVTIAGLFERRPRADGSDFFLGGVVVTFEPYLFAAAGCYGILRDGSKTVALFCLLEGPLIELEFAEVTGICGGFGYNTNLRFPTVDSVASYPLIEHSRVAGSPLDTIEQLLDPVTGCITASEGSVWLAAGLDVDAFKLLSMKAVVAVEFTTSGNVGLGIFADVKASFPAPPPPDAAGGGQPPAAFAFVELGIVATADFGAGVMMVQAQLAPSSFILDPSCHLTGGFALGYWFGANQHAGDWVFTIGGYHPRFTAPPYYPNPPRLAISWSLDDSLSITGQAYFALTPKVAMGGGELRASLSLSPLYAYFDAYADFLINFSPFYFLGDAGIDVGVRFTIDLWICTIHINIDIGAQLYLEGPPVHGYVHVDFWVFGFDIHFGDEQARPDPVTLKDFYYLLKQAAAAAPPNPPPPELEADPPTPPDPDADTIDGAQQLSCTGGLITSPNQDQTTTQTEAWQVRAGPFQFSVTSPFASDTASVAGGESTQGSGQPIYGRPMQNPNPIASTTTITITRTNSAGGQDPVTGFRIQRTISQVPSSMWKQYTQTEDPLPPPNTPPSTNGNYIPALLDGTTEALLPHMLTTTLLAPKPYYPGPVTEPLAAFNAADASAQDVLDHIARAAPLEGASDKWDAQALGPGGEDQEWVDVPKFWGAGAPAGGVEVGDAVARWVEVMGWTVGDGGLVGDAPGGLVAGFEGWVMAVPGMTAANA
ncbi:hypothetical protein C8A01DRAFT_35797 [Parachaetomium inaequale]|uniref:DUF6603 domain-containing protein n=1 Tax=Parachaetomium inaequale TaxID=2588326 RepID=A0AAN6PKL6_9PEZI|nr:hypothetical protein C8A01DRAFT_35797 [Parachaetomium inaequale]